MFIIFCIKAWLVPAFGSCVPALRKPRFSFGLFMPLERERERERKPGIRGFRERDEGEREKALAFVGLERDEGEREIRGLICLEREARFS